MSDSEAPRRLAVALSGGGHRAALWGLGVLLYLTDAGRNAQVSSIASVSGGSLTNATVGSALDYQVASPQDLAPVAALVARRSARGTVFAWWGTWAYLLALLGVFPAAIVAVWLMSWSVWLQVGATVVLALAWGPFAALRGRVCGRAFARTLLGGTPHLAALHTGVDHVICATDLHAGEHVYFSGRFVAAYRFGLGVPGDLALHRAVQASAAFPPVFPVTWIRTGSFGFQEPAEPAAAETRRLALTDGGVYDNMGDQWAQGLPKRATRWQTLGAHFQDAEELIVANASGGLEWRSSWTLRIPFLGELLALLRDKAVLYDNGTSVRRHALVDAFELAATRGTGLRGALVHIPQSPFLVPDAYQQDATDGRAARAAAALAALATDDEQAARARWTQIAHDNTAVTTTLLGLGDDVAARLLHHAYVLAMVNLHVLLDYPLLDVPDPERFRLLLDAGA